MAFYSGREAPSLKMGLFFIYLLLLFFYRVLLAIFAHNLAGKLHTQTSSVSSP